MRWNPQRHLSAKDPQWRELVDRKQRLIAESRTGDASKMERFLDLRAVTTGLRAPLAERVNRIRDELAATDQKLGANSVLRRRDYSFCLYPEETLLPFCTQFL
jgi:hypothetical protein